jgi:hypothetical protein
VGLAFFLWKRPNTPPVAVGDGAAGGTGVLAGAGVVAGEAAAVASFLDLFFGVALDAGVALVTGCGTGGLVRPLLRGCRSGRSWTYGLRIRERRSRYS